MASPQESGDDSLEPKVVSAPQEVIHEKGGEYSDNVAAVEANVQQLAEKLGDREDGLGPIGDMEFVMDKIPTLSIEECKDYVTTFLKEHEYDYNFGANLRAKINHLLEGPTKEQGTDEWELEFKAEVALMKFYSPYPEVRAITEPVDDLEMPAETIRAHLLGYIWALLTQFTNDLFMSRFPNISVSSQVIQILLYPCGKLCALILPDWGFTIGGKRHSLNPGPWSYKEQMLATIIVDVGLNTAYCFYNIQTQTLYYKDKWLTPGYGIILLLATQLMGLGFSGLLRRYVVYPIEAIWPYMLPTLALNRALLVPEKKETIHGWSLSRYKFFFIFFGAMFCYFWLPDFLFPVLSYFGWMTWIAPNNFNLNMITGSIGGMGFNPISSFDWNVISIYSAPLAYPLFSYCQTFAGQVLGGLIIIALYWTNTSWTAYLPINSANIFDNKGNSYNVTRVVNPAHGYLDEAAYQAYSPPFYSAANLVLYGAFFALYPLMMVFIILDSWRPLLKSYRSMMKALSSAVYRVFQLLKNTTTALLKGNLSEAGQHIQAFMNGDGTSIYDGFDDPFTQMMRNYAEVPDWWFFAIFVVAFIFTIIVVKNWPELDTPVWTVFFVIGINAVFLIPMSYLNAISGQTEGLNVVTELIIGYALPGHPEALMLIKAFGYNINGQADTYTSDQKMGFYAKLPPRAMYRGQVFSAIITAILCYGVVQFVDTIPGICTPNQKSGFTCENSSLVYYSSSVVWGAIGPKRVFAQLYPSLKYAFLVGFILALVWWGVKRAGPRIREGARSVLPSVIFKPLNLLIFTPMSFLKSTHPALIVNGMLYWAPLNVTYMMGGFYFSLAFMYYMRRYKTAWWEKYNYVLSAALTGGVAFSGIIIFFAVQYYPVTVSWWGTNILGETIDGGAGQQVLVTQLPAKGYFGPDTWH